MHDTESRIPQHTISIPATVEPEPAEVIAERRAKIVAASVDMTDDMRRHTEVELAKVRVRNLVLLPLELAASEGTVNLRRVVAGARVFAVWADVEPEILGQLSHAEPGLHGYLMNAQQFLDLARMALERATQRLPEWLKTFTRIVQVGTEEGAWEYVQVAAGALVQGPHSKAWAEAVEWFRNAWDIGGDIGGEG